MEPQWHLLSRLTSESGGVITRVAWLFLFPISSGDAETGAPSTRKAVLTLSMSNQDLEINSPHRRVRAPEGRRASLPRANSLISFNRKPEEIAEFPV